MCGKVILTLALIATVSIQLAHSLKCLTCYDVNSCRNPEKIQCNPTSANTTRNVLELYYNDVRYLNSQDFSCFSTRYGFNNITTLDLRGCIMTGTVDCLSYLADQTKKMQACNVCKKDLCNSVATISSSIVTVVAMIFIAKLFGM